MPLPMTTAPSEPRAPATIGALIHLDAEGRAEAIHAAAWTQLNETAIEVGRQGLTHPDTGSKRLAWAIGARISGQPERSYGGRFGPEAAVPGMLRELRLDDLAWSAACEQEPDGFPLTAGAAEAQRAFEALLRRDGAYVLNFVRAKARAGAEPADTAADAWHALFFTYFRPGAPHRFLALCTLKSVLCTIARRLMMQRDKPAASLDAPTGDDGGTFASMLAVAGAPAPGSSLEAAELRDLVLEAIDALPARQGLVTRLHLVEGLAQVEVAERLGCSRAYISQTLDRALAKVRESLGARGWGPAGDGKKSQPAGVPRR